MIRKNCNGDGRRERKVGVESKKRRERGVESREEGLPSVAQRKGKENTKLLVFYDAFEDFESSVEVKNL